MPISIAQNRQTRIWVANMVRCPNIFVLSPLGSNILSLILRDASTGSTIRIAIYSYIVNVRAQFLVVDGKLGIVEIRCGRQARLMSKQKETCMQHACI